MISHARRAAYLAAFFCLLAASCARNPGDSTVKLLPDPEIVSGKLENGLSYLIRDSDDPKGRLLVRLIVKVGAIDESPEESGVAHFLEHMAFNGTVSFPANELDRYFESIGMDSGDELNAFTSHEMTQYELEIPVDDPEVVAKAFKIAREWADGLTIDPAEVEKERGVILEEERLGRTAGNRAWKSFGKAVYGESPYLREIVGTPESIAAMTRERLAAFYGRWYRPDLMAVVVCGDLEAARAEGLVKAEFGSLAKREGPAPAVRGIAPSERFAVSTFADPELISTSGEWGVRVKAPVAVTEGDAVRQIRLGISRALLESRLAEAIRRSGGDRTTSASVDRSDLAGDDSVFTVSFSANGDDWQSAMAFVREEIARVARHGFGKDELERHRADAMSSLDDLVENGLTTYDHVADLEAAFAYGSVPYTLADSRRLKRAAFDSYSLKEGSDFAANLLAAESGYLVLSSPGAASAAADPAACLAALRAAPPETGPWKAAEKGEGLTARKPAAVAPKTAVGPDEFGLTTLSYANGITVVLKPTDFEEDEILFNMWWRGGFIGFDRKEFANILIGANMIPGGGFAGMPPEALKAELAGKTASLGASVGPVRCGLSGSSNRADLETLFALARRATLDPEIDGGYLDMARTNLVDYIRNREKDPEELLSDEISRTLYPEDWRNGVLLKEADLSLLKADDMGEAVRSLFVSPAGATVTIVGSFAVSDVRPLCDVYFGSMKTGSGTWTPSASPESVPVPGTADRTVRAGVEERASVTMVFKTPKSDVDEVTVNGLDVLAEGLSRRLRDTVREGEGGTYGVGVRALTVPDFGFSTITVSFECDPARVDELAGIVRREAGRLAKSGLENKTIDEIRLAWKKDRDVAMRENDYWLGELVNCQVLGIAPDVEGNLDRALAGITTEWTRKAAARYLDPDNLATFRLLPAGK